MKIWSYIQKNDARFRVKIRKLISRCLPERAVIWAFDFDVYTRHNLVAKSLFKKELSPRLVLDVGGRINSLATFLPSGLSDCKIVVLNTEFNDLINRKFEKVFAVQGDGACLPFADNIFDAVASITTLEHIDRDQRESYIRELSRVAKNMVVLYVPIGPVGDHYEKLLYKWSLDSHIRFMTKQHIDKGLPALKEIKDVVPDCSVMPVQNAAVWFFTMVMKQMPFAGIIFPNLLYAFFLRHLKIRPFYEYLIVVNKKNPVVGKNTRKRILIISKCLPRPDKGSGHVRFMAIVGMLARQYDITFVAENFSKTPDLDDSKYYRMLEAMGVRVFADGYDWGKVFKTRCDIVIFEWYHVALERLPLVRRAFPSIKVIIDTVDIHFVRELQMAEVHDDDKMRRIASENKKKELDVYRQADLIWAVTDDDRKALLRESPSFKVDVIPNIHKIEKIDRSNIEKNTILFIGNFLHQPNEDAVVYFCGEIFPKIKEEVPDAVFKIVGNSPTQAVKALAMDSVKVIGWVPDTRPYLEKCHISVAPLRYGAGLKGKIGEAMSAGVPVVTTQAGVQGMDVVNGKDIFYSDSPDEFARMVIRILRDDELLKKLSRNSMDYIKNRYTPEIVEKLVISSINRVEDKT